MTSGQSAARLKYRQTVHHSSSNSAVLDKLAVEIDKEAGSNSVLAIPYMFVLLASGYLPLVTFVTSASSLANATPPPRAFLQVPRPCVATFLQSPNHIHDHLRRTLESGPTIHSGPYSI